MKKQKHDTVRLTIDFPVNQHTYIKIMAAKEGISMQQFIINRLPNPKPKKNIKETRLFWCWTSVSKS